ncbi:MAG: radical SAM protein [Clostridia bacterium]|nr:radical SAM protein [Clostridia bacterium]
MSQLLNMLASKEGLEKADAFYQYLRKASFEKGIPLIGCFELTPRCTLDCKMCYVHLYKNQMREPELTTEQWISLIDQACDAGMLFATLTGGECLTYPGFKEIYEYLQSRGVLVTLLTNGTLLDQDIVNWLAERPPERIQISVYGSSLEGYGKVTGVPEAFNKVDRAINLLVDAGLPVSFAVTVSKQLLPDFEPIVRYCESKIAGVTRINSMPFETRPETGRLFESYAPSLDEQVEAYRIRQKIFLGSHERKTANEEYVENRQHGVPVPPETGIVCMAGMYGFAINWNGKMIPCNNFDYSGRYPLNEGFLSAWQYINQKCREYKNPYECIGCAYYGICRHCPAGHYRKAGEGHVDPDVCAEAKRMVAEKIRYL